MTDDIEIVDYNPNWPAAFRLERERLYDALTGENILELFHFGSTAIKGMPAKPSIDILLVVPDLNAAKVALPEKLDRIGYDYWADNPKRDRLFFVRGMPPPWRRAHPSRARLRAGQRDASALDFPGLPQCPP